MGTQSSKDANNSGQRTTKSLKVGLLGGTGKVGGWVLEEGLQRGYTIRMLCRSPEKVDHMVKVYPDTLSVVTGSATDLDSMIQLLAGVDVVISTLGSPNNDTLVMTPAARVLVEALAKVRSSPRVIWMTSIGVNDAVSQGHQYGCSKSFFPSCSCCCGHGLMGCLIFKILVPKVIGSDLWEDMGTSEDVFTAKGGDILARTVFVRPTNMTPPTEHAAFSESWRKDGGTNNQYITRRADEPPPNMWITRRAVSACVLDLVENKGFDGTAVSVFQGEAKSDVVRPVQ